MLCQELAKNSWPSHPANLVNRVSLNPLPPLRKLGFWFGPRNQVTTESQQQAGYLCTRKPASQKK